MAPRGPWLPALGGFAGLAVTVLAFGDLPLLGSVFGAVLSGAIAGLLARGAAEGARGALLAGAGAVGLLTLLAATGGGLFGRPAAASVGPVLVVQALLLGVVPAGVAALAGWLAAEPPPPPPPLRPPRPGP